MDILRMNPVRSLAQRAAATQRAESPLQRRPSEAGTVQSATVVPRWQQMNLRGGNGRKGDGKARNGSSNEATAEALGPVPKK